MPSTGSKCGELVRRPLKETLLAVGAKLTTDNVYALELENGSRVRGAARQRLLRPEVSRSTGWIIADEAARLSEELIAAVRPMRARRPEARLCDVVDGRDPNRSILDPENDDQDLDQDRKDHGMMNLIAHSPRNISHKRERKALSEADFKREILAFPPAALSVHLAGSCTTGRPVSRATPENAPVNWPDRQRHRRVESWRLTS